MRKSEEIKELKRQLDNLKNFYEDVCEEKDEYYEKYENEKNLKKEHDKENEILKTKIADLETINNILTQALCDKFHHGSAILYDEQNPRIIKIIKDGKYMETQNIMSVYFNWNANEFPTLEITR